MTSFIIRALCSALFLGIGIYALCARKPVRVWANLPAPDIAPEHVKPYNTAVGMLLCVFAAAMLLLGLPLLAGQNSPWVLVTILGTVFSSIFLVVAYLGIETKYRKK